jgi:hypothetical protein
VNLTGTGGKKGKKSNVTKLNWNWKKTKLEKDIQTRKWPTRGLLSPFLKTSSWLKKR